MTIKYASLLSKTGFGQWKSEELPNCTGEYRTIVFKVKTSDTMLGGTTKLSFTMGKTPATANATIQGTGTDGYQYIVFDMADENLFGAFKVGEPGGRTSNSLRELTLTWLDGQFINKKVLDIPAEDRVMTIYAVEICSEAAADKIAELGITAAPVADLVMSEPPAETVESVATTAPATTAAETTAAKGGCGGVIAASSVAALVVLAGASALVVSKKKED